MNQKIREVIETFVEDHPGLDSNDRSIEILIKDIQDVMLEASCMAARSMIDMVSGFSRNE